MKLLIDSSVGISFDATVVRALLVPALMRLVGGADRWLPDWAHLVLRLPREPATDAA